MINNTDVLMSIALVVAVIGGLLGLIFGRTKESLIKGTIMGFAVAGWGMFCLLILGIMICGLRLLLKVVFG